jgi:hypothetical protein
MADLLRAVLRGFAAGPYTASVQIVGSRSAYLDDVPVSRAIPAAELVPGRDCVVLFFESTDPADAMLIAVH